MWQPVKVLEWGIESVGVRGEPTTHRCLCNKNEKNPVSKF